MNETLANILGEAGHVLVALGAITLTEIAFALAIMGLAEIVGRLSERGRAPRKAGN